MEAAVTRDWDEHRCYVPRTGALKGEHAKSYCVFASGQTLWIQGCRADGTHVQSEATRVPFEDVDELIRAMRFQMAGPLGKMAIAAEVEDGVG
jgi:hypothetical protein